jgi:hypothetical protein
MKNLAFLIWMFGFPTLVALLSQLDYPAWMSLPEVIDVASFVFLLVWIGSGIALYEPTRRTDESSDEEET